MEEQAQRYPLAWPAGWKRTSFNNRKVAAFSKRETVSTGVPGGNNWTRKKPLEVGDGVRRLLGELRRLHASNIIISSNLRLRQDGLPIAGQSRILDDPGVAVYFRLKGKARVLACDKWRSVADNLAAVAGHIEAIRASDRYGVGDLDQAFAGYTALPANTAADWRSVFGIPAGGLVTPAMVEDRFREMARKAHPDSGGSELAMARLNEAREFARQELGA